MKMSLISVIIPIYKVEPYLDHCVQSIVEQTYNDLEIILVDDGSPDNCGAMCDSWAEKDPRIKVIHKPNGGVSDARNKGLEIATGNYICFIDADDYVSPCLMEKLVCNCSSEGIAVCNYRTKSMSDTIDASIETDNTFTVQLHNIKDLTRSREGLFCWGILFPQEIIMREPVVLFDTQLSNLEDTVWLGIVMTRVKQITFVDWENPMYFYLSREGAVTNNCADSMWQATCWNKARSSIEDNDIVVSNKLDSHGKRIVRQMSRHCLKNLYGECLAGQMSLSEIKKLSHRPKYEALLYKTAFSMKTVIRRG